MSKRPYLKTVRALIDAILEDERNLILTNTFGEPITEELPNRDRNVLVDDCYACDSANVTTFRREADGKLVLLGEFFLMPYEANEADEIVADCHANEFCNTTWDKARARVGQ